MTDSRTNPISDLLFPFQEEFNDFFLGGFIAEGVHRQVFSNPQRPTEEVIKVEKNVYGGEFSNVLEMSAWRRLKDHTEAGRWLAPCVAISRSGNILAQRRTDPIRDDEISDEVPRFLWDAHRKNWGLFEGRPVVHDYAFNSLMDIPRRLKMVARRVVGTKCKE